MIEEENLSDFLQVYFKVPFNHAFTLIPLTVSKFETVKNALKKLPYSVVDNLYAGGNLILDRTSSFESLGIVSGSIFHITVSLSGGMKAGKKRKGKSKKRFVEFRSCLWT